MKKLMKNNLAFYRKKEGLTQSELGKIVGVTKDYISMIERGITNPGFNLSKKLADVFCTTIDAIFFEAQPNENFDETQDTA